MGELSLPVVGNAPMVIELRLELDLSRIEDWAAILQLVHVVDARPLHRVLQVFEALQPILSWLVVVRRARDLN